MNLSLFTSIKEVKSNEHLPVDVFFDNIRNGFWQDFVIPVRAITDKDKRQEAKKRIPSVTISGIFPVREDKECKIHSGLIGVDIDNLGAQVEAVKAILAHDLYVHAVFTSVSGYGLCVVFRIESDRHREAFAAISDYLIKKYQILTDHTGVNPSRARYVSYDPGIIVNDHASLFKKYLPKEKKKVVSAIFVRTEFDDIVRQMCERGVSCVDDYRDWLKVSFALADHLGEAGRDYFHRLSTCSNKYEYAMCDKQYDHAIKRLGRGGAKVTISTIYYYAKDAGINIASETTKKISSITSSLKKSGLNIDTIIGNLEKFEGITREQSESVVTQAYDSGMDYTDKDTLVDSLIAWIRHSYSLRRNVVTLRVENNGASVEDVTLNSMFLEAKKIFPEATFDLVTRCIYSHNVDSYNPFLEWWQVNKDIPYNDEIARLWSCLETDDAAKLIDFGTRWLVGIVSGIYGTASPLLLVLAGEVHGKGKTEWFRRLFPAAFRSPVDYYAESRLDGGKDDDIMMCQKLLIMDDEYDGKSKKEEKRIKSLTSKDTFTIRVPYGRTSTDMKRLCALGGTANELDLLNDPTGNRRIIPIQVLGINWERYNSIDKTALFAELFRMYHAGYKWQVHGAEMAKLNASTERFINYSTEYELIMKFFQVPGQDDRNISELTASEIKTAIEARTNQRTNLNRIGQELKRMGYAQLIKKREGVTARVYRVVEKSQSGIGIWPVVMSGPSTQDTDIKLDAPNFDDLYTPF